jgi:hypothetical protein
MGLWPFSKKEEPAAPPADKPKKKICCACPDTKVSQLSSDPNLWQSLS